MRILLFRESGAVKNDKGEDYLCPSCLKELLDEVGVELYQCPSYECHNSFFEWDLKIIARHDDG